MSVHPQTQAKSRHRQQAVAPHDGVVMFLVTTLAMNAGDPLLAVGA